MRARIAVLFVTITSCTAVVQTAPTAPNGPTGEEVEASPPVTPVQSAEPDDISEYDAKMKSEAEATEAKKKAAADAFAAKAKQHKDDCAATFTDRLSAAKARIASKPKPCAWIRNQCEMKKVVKKQDGKTYLDEDYICSGPKLVQDPKAWLAANGAKCTQPWTDEDARCANVDPIRIDGDEDDVAAFKQ